MSKGKSLSRRAFIKGSVAAGVALGMKTGAWAESPAGKKLYVSVQLYSVRDDCGQDYDGAMERVAKMGVDGFEFAGYHGYVGKPRELRRKLDDLGVKGIATHIGTGSFRGDKLKKTIEFHQIIGCKFLIVPGDGDFTDPEKSKPLAELFDKTAQILKPLGMACGYHNHTGEFKKDGDKTYFDLFAERTSRDVVLQQDCGWTAAAGLDPVELMKRHPGRMKIQHFKPTVVGDDKTKKAFLGQDSVDWPAVIKATREVGGGEWITLEQESYPDGKTPMECCEISLKALKQMV